MPDRTGAETRAPRAGGRAIGSGIALGIAIGWNSANTGAVADNLAHAYGVSLGTIGLLTTALFIGQVVMILPAGLMIDRRGTRVIGTLGMVVLAVGNGVALIAPDRTLGVTGRVLAGIGGAIGTQAGAVVVRGGGSRAEGLVGSAQVTGAGLAVALVPHLIGPLDWRAPFASGLAVAIVGLPFVLAGPQRTGGRMPSIRSELHGISTAIRDHRLWRNCALFAVSVGLGTAVGNWIVPLLTRTQHIGLRSAGLIGALVFIGAAISRPRAGKIIHEHPRLGNRIIAGGLAVVAAALLVLASVPPLWVAIVAVAVFGIANGIPFGPVIAGAAASRPEHPSNVIAVVVLANLLTAMVAVPLMGAAFSLPSEGRLGFAAAAALTLLAIAAVPGRLKPTPLPSEA
jgi:MFS family permease